MCQVEANKKWAKYIIKNVLRQIKTLDGLMNISIAIAEKVFETTTKMKPK